jgi:hypothetical protein
MTIVAYSVTMSEERGYVPLQRNVATVAVQCNHVPEALAAISVAVNRGQHTLEDARRHVVTGVVETLKSLGWW